MTQEVGGANSSVMYYGCFSSGLPCVYGTVLTLYWEGGKEEEKREEGKKEERREEGREE